MPQGIGQIVEMHLHLGYEKTQHKLAGHYKANASQRRLHLAHIRSNEIQPCPGVILRLPRIPGVRLIAIFNLLVRQQKFIQKFRNGEGVVKATGKDEKFRCTPHQTFRGLGEVANAIEGWVG